MPSSVGPTDIRDIDDLCPNHIRSNSGFLDGNATTRRKSHATRKIYDDVTGTIGDTPMVRINRLIPPEQATVFAKCEFFQPLNSVKDRIGVAMIEAGERGGQGSSRTRTSSNRQAATPASPWPSCARPRAIG